jgi:two-component system chemotaxis sensor kinase CheA
MEDPLGPIRAGFFLECDELLGALDDALADAAFSGNPHGARDDAGDDAAVHAAFRAVHSIKGGAASLGLGDLAAAAHRFETSLAARRDGVAAAAALPRTLWQGAADHLAAAVGAARTGVPLAAKGDALAEALAGARMDARGAVAENPVARPASKAWQIRFSPDAALEARGVHPVPLLRALTDLGGTGLACDLACDMSALPPLDDIGADTAALTWSLALPDTLAEADIRAPFAFLDAEAALQIFPSGAAGAAPKATPEAAPEPTGAAATTTAPQTIRVDLARVDRLLNLAGELLIGKSLLATRMAEAGLSRSSAAQDALDQLAATCRTLQESVVALRSEPVKPLFQRMGRILREAARATGKEVSLSLSGEATELDRSVIERLTEPLTHLIRNAVDHGIEPPETRSARGKPPEGRVSLTATLRAGRVVIEVADDGAGLDRAKILARGAALGLMPPSPGTSPAWSPAADRDPHRPAQGRTEPRTAFDTFDEPPLATADERTADSLLFRPGLSTAAEVTELSGRGVGLDVVRTALASIGGRVSVTSRPGQGARFTLSLPLTLSVLDVLLVRIAGRTFALPQSAVIETRLAEMLTPAAPTGTAPGVARSVRDRLVAMHGRHVPLCAACDLLRLTPTGPDTEPHPVAILLTDERDRWLALSVDAILDQTQVVMKGLGAALDPASGIAAATILNDGQVALILDPPGLMSLASAPAARNAA